MSDIDDYSSDDNEVFEINQNKYKQSLLNAGKIQTNKIQKKNIDAYMEDNEDEDDNVEVDEDDENDYDDNNESYNKNKIKKNGGKTIDDINDDEDDDEDENEDENDNKSDDEDDDGNEDDEDNLYKQEGGIGDDGNNDDDDFDEDDDDDDEDDEYQDINGNVNKKKTKNSKSKANLIQPSLLNIDKENIDYGDDDEDDEDDENYLQKFDKDINKNYIVDYHPECIIHNYDEVIKLTHIVRDSNNIIIDPLHRTIPFLTKYERARVLGQRSKQIETGAKPFVKVPENVIDSYVIAELELQQKRIPFIIRRPLPSGAFEYWNLADLENILF